MRIQLHSPGAPGVCFDAVVQRAILEMGLWNPVRMFAPLDMEHQLW